MAEVRVLGIETSCDETAAAIVTENGEVFADVVASQIAEHAPFGGVVPELAARAHLRAIVPVIEAALDALPGGLDDVEGIAVTQGPGLIGALLTGIHVAKALAFARGLPLIGVDHLDGHLFAAHLRHEGAEAPEFPFVALLASGGHTALYRVAGLDEVELLGQTRDDAAGEAFDKAAKLLGLGYPGGPVIDRLASKGDARAVALPMPMASRKTYDFSFSGLKTALARHVQKTGGPKDEAALADLCASFQRSVVEVLARKTIAASADRNIPRIVLCGGVAANQGLRTRAAALAADRDIALHVPPLRSCTDNAAMIAYVGAQRLAAGQQDDPRMLAPYSRDPARRRGKFRRDGSLVPLR